MKMALPRHKLMPCFLLILCNQMTQIDGFNTEVDAHPEAKVEDVISGADVLEDAPNVIDEVLFLRDKRYPIYYWTQSRLMS